MKVLLVSEFFPIGKNLKFSGGVEARTYYLARYLAKNQNDVTVLTSQINTAPREEKLEGFRILRVGPKRSYSATAGGVLERIFFIKDAIKIGKNLDCEIVDGSNFITHLIAKRIATSKKIPAVAWYPDVWTGSWITNAGIVGILGEILERFNLASGFDKYIAISKSTAKKLPKKVDGKIEIIPCGIDKKEFKNGRKKSDATIICVSRLAKYKNVKDLLFAFALVSMKIKAKLIIIGTGPEDKALKSLAENLKIRSKVQFFSNLPRRQLINLYQSSTIFCLPSRVEGFGISIIEASASGTPYVVSDIEVFREITKNGQGGLLFKLGDIKDLASKLETLLNDNKIYKKKQQEGLNLTRNYSWDDVALQTESIYKTLLK